jgi:hypothetical protein
MVLGLSLHLLWCLREVRLLNQHNCHYCVTFEVLTAVSWRFRSLRRDTFIRTTCPMTRHHVPEDWNIQMSPPIFLFLSLFYEKILCQCDGYVTSPTTVTIFYISYILLHSDHCIVFQCASKVKNLFLFYLKNSVLKIFIYICASCTAYKNNVCPHFMAPPERVIALRSHPPPPPTPTYYL